MFARERSLECNILRFTHGFISVIMYLIAVFTIYFVYDIKYVSFNNETYIKTITNKIYPSEPFIAINCIVILGSFCGCMALWSTIKEIGNTKYTIWYYSLLSGGYGFILAVSLIYFPIYIWITMLCILPITVYIHNYKLPKKE